MSLNDSFLKLKFDKRMKTWNLNQELVTQKEIKESLENLQDVSENAEQMVLFPDPPDKTTDQQTSQALQEPAPQEPALQESAPQEPALQEPAPQVPTPHQEQQILKEKDDTAYNTQPSSTVTDQTDLPKAHEDIATEEASNKEENKDQKPNEDPSNPWW